MAKHGMREAGYKKAPRGSAGPFDSGFSEGEHGRGPSPYLAGHSVAAGSAAQHKGTAGRGASGIFGKGDTFKGRAEDVEAPCTHSEFEKLGRD